MRRWIGFACGAAVLCAAAWYFGRPVAAPESKVLFAVQAPPNEVPKAPPPKMVEVIDLARAYEPVREPEPVLIGGVDPAMFIEERDAPERIPFAIRDEDMSEERIDVVPRNLTQLRETFYRHRLERESTPGGFESLEMPEIWKTTAERLDMMPRVIPDDGPLNNLLHVPDFPYPVRLDVEPSRVSTLLKQIVELYSYVGFGPVWLGDVANPHEPVRLEIMPREVKYASVLGER